MGTFYQTRKTDIIFQKEKRGKMDFEIVEKPHAQNESIWADQSKASKEIREKNEPVNYSKIVGQNRVVFLGENHNNHAIREHVLRHAQEIKDSGITHYAIEADEASNEVLEKLNNGEPVDISNIDVGPGRASYEQAIRAMVRAGIKVVAVDIDQSKRPSKEGREQRLTDNLLNILQDPNAKVAVLIGAFHTSRNYASEGVNSLARRVSDLEIPSTNIRFTGGSETIPRNLTEPISRVFLGNTEFMLDLAQYHEDPHVPYGIGEVDWVINLG